MADQIIKAAESIRKAWHAGRKQVSIDGTIHVIRKVEHNVTLHDKDNKIVKRTESWLVAKPKDKNKLTPVYNVELESGKNSRVRLGTPSLPDPRRRMVPRLKRKQKDS